MDKNTTRRKFMREFGVGSAGAFGLSGVGTTAAAPDGVTSNKIDILAENEHQRIFKLYVDGSPRLFRDFYGGPSTDSKSEGTDGPGEIVKSGSTTLQLIRESGGQVLQTEGTSTTQEPLARRVSESDLRLDGTAIYLDGRRITGDTDPLTTSVTTAADIDDVVENGEWWAYWDGTCNGVVYSDHYYLGVAVEFTDDLETIISAGVAGAICYFFTSKLKIPNNFWSNTTCAAALSLPAEEVVDRTWTGGFYDFHGGHLNEEHVGFGYGFSLGKYHIPDAWELFNVPGPHCELAGYIS